ncbi:hypothetical protein J6I90_06480 [Pseudidiomarina sp. 1APP75-32.1]|uniref:Uncharacterized protein n=1 Tax=Pseudidiomarina terrestris TaxID=2820060 RepID=A0AAW7QZQ8_9GAMM|nr:MULTISPECIES: abortive infection system antitoxin AbiGi family protein [unclassified Pseudidiomarina]MDN7124523.1 hypothetical protein [Pseudidiomarina sp. 1APP75-32.1]MDN7129186.1 hypothetical protein [Pseudidiomarina sp. 1APR75-15]
MGSRTESLFHYTASLDNLKAILSSRFFWPKYCAEELSWFSESKESQEKVLRIAHPMVCFCDIPIGRANEHTRRYGSFGIGMKRKWVESKNINPVTYIAKRDSKITSALNHVVSAATKNFQEPELDYLRFFIAHIKPIRGMVSVHQSKQKTTVDFYKEAEWRHVARADGIEPYLSANICDDASKLKSHNNKAKNLAPLNFEISDISYLLVDTEEDVVEMVEFIQSKLRNVVDTKERSLLLTKIHVLDGIKKDV